MFLITTFLMVFFSCGRAVPPGITKDSCPRLFDGPCVIEEQYKFKCGVCESIYMCAKYRTDALEWGAAGDLPCDCVTEEGTLETTREECRYDTGPE
jgi:hypothetical protein